MATPTTSCLPPIKISRVRVRVSLILLLFFTTLISPSSSSPAKPSYSNYCNSIVPESTATSSFLDSTNSFQLSSGYFTGGDAILGNDPNSTFSIPRSFFFRPRSLYKTLALGVLKITGTLTFRGGGIRVSHRNLTNGRSLLRIVRPRNPRTFNQRGRVSFDLDGFWSESIGKLCMVGNGFGRSKEGISLELSAVFKMNYPKTSNISSSVVAGTVESLDDVNSLNYFDPISILVYTQKNYEFTKISEAMKSCSVVKVREESLGFEYNSICAYLNILLSQRFKLEYKNNCSGRNCGPFDRSLGFSLSFMSLNQIQCSENGKLRMFIGFSNRSRFGFNGMLELEKTLVSEGAWDQEKNQLCLVACRVLNVKGFLSQVDDCTIRLTLWFPSILSIENRSTIRGHMWSNQDENDSGYFDMVSFGDVENRLYNVPGLKYKYTKMDLVEKSCVKGDSQKIGKRRYPDKKYIEDMRFDMSLRNTEGKSAWGYANPLFVGETLYSIFPAVQLSVPAMVEINQSLLNVSYKIWYTFRNASVYVNEETEISAEGIYDARSGMLCMVGCRHVGSSMDCGILINIQLAPLNPKEGEHLNGTIRSTREKLDPLFFTPLEISSYGMYKNQAVESIWWMDIEITMVLISLTLSCIFIGLQLFHIKKNPDVLPSISITMLVILTLGHMIPLVLNFEAFFFRNHNGQNVLSRSGGWLEVNEVVVRVMIMAAFLFQFRLLQVAWSARSADEGKKGLWVAERKTVLLCLPLYIVGGLIALLVHLRSYGTQRKRLDFVAAHHHSLWEDLMSYAGLILDGFLLPQFILNIFWSSKDKALAPSFYVGTTVVRALPHVYDAYRAQHYVPHLNSSYIYASPNGDFYSSVWDIIIPCEGVLFAVLIYLQQRFGGACILPRRIKEPGGYEMVPVVSQ